MGIDHFKALNFTIFSKSKSSLFEVGGLWIFICFGWLTASSYGISCYTCNYYHLNGSVFNENCLDPVKNNMAAFPFNDSDGIGPYVCWKTTWDRPVWLGGRTLERYSTTWARAESVGATFYNKCITELPLDEGLRTYCYCATDGCNSQPGLETTDMTDPNATTPDIGDGDGGGSENGTCKILSDLSAQVICFSLILLMYFVVLSLNILSFQRN